MAMNNSLLTRDQLTIEGIYQGANSSIEITLSDSGNAHSLPAIIVVIKVDPCHNASEKCAECGNGVVDIGEECDNGVTDGPDGCNDSCHVLPLFKCYGAIGDNGVCRHVDIDLNKFDSTTRNLSLVFFRANEDVFLVDDHTLDASEYGDEVSRWIR